MPAPSADQPVPFLRAILLVDAPPAVVNTPPATRSPFDSVVKARTLASMPAPSADQLPPFQRATLLVPTPPALANIPPTTRSPFASVSSAVTIVPKEPTNPDPRADQLAPSQRARALALTLPAVVKEPPATTSPFGSAARALAWDASVPP